MRAPSLSTPTIQPPMFLHPLPPPGQQRYDYAYRATIEYTANPELSGDRRARDSQRYREVDRKEPRRL